MAFWVPLIGSIIGAAGTAAAGASQSRAASNAARAQEEADRRNLAFQQRMYQDQLAMSAPFRAVGQSALMSVAGDLGLSVPQNAMAMPGSTGMAGGPDYMAYLQANPDVAAAMPFGYDPEEWAAYHYQAHGRGEGRNMPLTAGQQGTQGGMNAMAQPASMTDTLTRLRATPGYQFQVEEGQRGLDAMLGKSGMFRSGAAMLEAQRRGQGLADQLYDRDIQRRMTLAGYGPAANQQAMSAGNQLTNVFTQGSQNSADARASSFQARANAQGALYGGLAGIGQELAQGWGGWGGSNTMNSVKSAMSRAKMGG